MPLPEFRPDGWLPEGHHSTSWDEIAARFGGAPGSRRAAVLSGLLQWRDAARAKGLAGLIILDGSFISRKDAPGDFDLFFLYDEATEASLKTDAEARTLTDHRSCHAAGFRGDAVIEDVQQLSASLRYMAGWADLLEGLRCHAQETDATLLPTTSAGPLDELRRVLAEAREYVDALPDAPQSAPSSGGSKGSVTTNGEPERLLEKAA